jgi:hypothetical protein
MEIFGMDVRRTTLSDLLLALLDYGGLSGVGRLRAELIC